MDEAGKLSIKASRPRDMWIILTDTSLKAMRKAFSDLNTEAITTVLEGNEQKTKNKLMYRRRQDHPKIFVFET